MPVCQAQTASLVMITARGKGWGSGSEEVCSLPKVTGQQAKAAGSRADPSSV